MKNAGDDQRQADRRGKEKGSKAHHHRHRTADQLAGPLALVDRVQRDAPANAAEEGEHQPAIGQGHGQRLTLVMARPVKKQMAASQNGSAPAIPSHRAAGGVVSMARLLPMLPARQAWKAARSSGHRLQLLEQSERYHAVDGQTPAQLEKPDGVGRPVVELCRGGIDIEAEAGQHASGAADHLVLAQRSDPRLFGRRPQFGGPVGIRSTDTTLASCRWGRGWNAAARRVAASLSRRESVARSTSTLVLASLSPWAAATAYQ